MIKGQIEISGALPVPERCGIVMPLSPIDGCSADHWQDVKEIVSEAIEGAGFEPMLVSDADEIGVIHKRIVQNLYDNPVVVCDVSGKNPNVMFELGLRLAFDKPTIIIKDDATSYNFDTSAIEHLEYPRDLRFQKIVDFSERLAEKIKNTHTAYKTDPGFTTFLKHFGEFKVPVIDQKEVPENEFILEELKNVRALLERSLTEFGTRQPQRVARRASPRLRPGHLDICLRNLSSEQIDKAKEIASDYEGASSVHRTERSPGHFHLIVTGSSKVDFAPLRDAIVESFSRV